MSQPVETRLEGIEAVCRKMDCDMNEIKRALLGDLADPTAKPGMIVRIDRLERSEKIRSKFLWLIGGGFVTLLADKLRGTF